MTFRLVLVPAVITLAVTILRLAGELRHWPAKWFSPETGGIAPSGVSWIIGITWLAFFPQLVGWVGFTVTLGAVAGILAAFLAGLCGLPVRAKVDRIDVG